MHTRHHNQENKRRIDIMPTLRMVTEVSTTVFGGTVYTELNRFSGTPEDTTKGARELAKQSSYKKPCTGKQSVKYIIETWNPNDCDWVLTATYKNGYSD
jgi:hypothetical protein